MNDIEHILYNTIGTNFEEYLEGVDMITLSQVCKTTREGKLTTKFRKLLECTYREYKIFKKNNSELDSVDLTMDRFIQSIPLSIIYKNPTLDIYKLLDYLNCNEETRLYVFIELSKLDDFKRYIDKNTIEDHDYWSLIFQANIRLRDDIVEFLFYYPRDTNALECFEDYYPANERLRKLYVDRFPEHIASIMDKNSNITDPMSFGLIDTTNYFSTLLWLTTSFQKQYIFREYYNKDGSIIPNDIEKILEIRELKYNINPYHPKLMTEKQIYMESEDTYMYETYS